MRGSISFRPNQLIRELEFLNPRHTFNETSRDTKRAYRVILGRDGESLLIAHSPSENEGIPCGIGLVIVFYVNGIRQKIEEAKSRDSQGPPDQSSKQDLFRIKLKQEQLELQQSHSLEITTAYKLQKLPEGFETNLDLVPLQRYYRFDEVLAMAPYAHLSFSPDAYVDFIVRRNLEHILSVCSIPVTLEGDTKPMVALTCGDMSGHRLTAKASL